MGRKPDPEVRPMILREAEHLIHLRGFHHTSMDEIARSCKMTKANLFHHFGSKEELALAVLDAKIADYREKRVSPLCAGGDPVRAVVKMFEDCASFYDGNGCRAGCFVGNIALEMSDLSEAFRKRAGGFFKEWADNMAACLERSRAGGFFKDSLDPRAAAETILSLYEGAAMMARTRRDPAIFLRVGRMAASLLEQHRNRKGRDKHHGTENALRVLSA